MGEKFEGYALLELMGHRQLAGFVREVEVAGHAMLRVDVPEIGGDPKYSTFVSPASLYCLTPVTVDVCLAQAEMLRVRPALAYGVRLQRKPETLRFDAEAVALDESDEEFDDE